MSALHGFLFQVYPYVCFTVFLVGSLIRFDQNQYSWKSDSSQMLRTGTLRWGSNLFHVGILFLFFGHLVGLFTPHAVYGVFMSAATKQMMAVVAGGIAGTLCFVGLSLLLYRRIFDPRIRYTSHPTDIAVLLILWVQLTVGLITLPYSLQHADGSVMLILADWAQRIVTLRPVDARPWPPALALSISHRLWHDDLPAVPVQPAGPCVERLCLNFLPAAALPGITRAAPEPADRPQPAAATRRALNAPNAPTHNTRNHHGQRMWIRLMRLQGWQRGSRNSGPSWQLQGARWRLRRRPRELTHRATTHTAHAPHRRAGPGGQRQRRAAA
jgi:nitrate reductase gamma subunit